jgi:NAD-dependent deacetylase
VTLAGRIDAAERTVVFTGAGISTESGIPDFRSPGGVWTRLKPIYFEDFISDEDVRREAWRRLFDGEYFRGTPRPNAGHHAVAALIASGKADCVVTQNIDNLHQDSGVPEEKVIELHGNVTYAKCLDCALRIELTVVREQYERLGTAEPCPCGGLVKAATISFGQPMPEQEMQRALDAALACDLMLAIGSSLSVYPAAMIPLWARKNGARLVILNRDPTELDPYANLVINAEIGPAMTALLADIGLPSAKP